LTDIIENRKQKKEDPEKRELHLKDKGVTYGLSSVLRVVQERRESGDIEDYYGER
jgi:hypothetical protein